MSGEPGRIVSPGAVLGGRYRIDELLGRGAIAEVYRGSDQVLARSVAIKVFHPGISNPINVARQRAEMQVLANLQHPNLLKVYDARFGDDPVSGVPPQDAIDGALTYKVMELVDGGPLANRITQSGIASSEVARVGAAAASGLAAIHQFGLVHRDIRPANILLSRSGEVKISDFGFARELEAERIATTVEVAGSTAFLSPEQARGAAVGPPSDVYALGLVLLECLTGHREYPGLAIESAIARLNRIPVVPASLPESWHTLLRAMTTSDPAQRPTAAQVAATLAGFRAVAPAPPPPREPLPQPIPAPPPMHEDRSPASFGRIVGVVLLVLLVTAGLIVGTVAVVRNNEGKQVDDSPQSTTLTISRGATSVVTTTETSREVIAPTLPTLPEATRPTKDPTTPTIPSVTTQQRTVPNQATDAPAS